MVFEICMIVPCSSPCIVRYRKQCYVCMMLQSVAEFLKGLPSYDENNFARFHTDSGSRSCAKRPSLYLPTKDYPSEQSQFTQQSLPLVFILIQRKSYRTFTNEQYSLISNYKLKFNTYKCLLLLIILNYVQVTCENYIAQLVSILFNAFYVAMERFRTDVRKVQE